MPHDSDEKQQKNLSISLKRLFRAKQLDRQDRVGRRVEKIITTKPSNKRDRREAKNRLNRQIMEDDYD